MGWNHLWRLGKGMVKELHPTCNDLSVLGLSLSVLVKEMPGDITFLREFNDIRWSNGRHAPQLPIMVCSKPKCNQYAKFPAYIRTFGDNPISLHSTQFLLDNVQINYPTSNEVIKPLYMFPRKRINILLEINYTFFGTIWRKFCLYSMVLYHASFCHPYDSLF